MSTNSEVTRVRVTLEAEVFDFEAFQEFTRQFYGEKPETPAEGVANVVYEASVSARAGAQPHGFRVLHASGEVVETPTQA